MLLYFLKISLNISPLIIFLRIIQDGTKQYVHTSFHRSTYLLNYTVLKQVPIHYYFKIYSIQQVYDCLLIILLNPARFCSN